MVGPDPVALFYIYVVWALSVPSIVAIASLIRMFESRGAAQIFAAAALLCMVILFFSLLIFDLPWLLLGVALFGVGFWFASLTFATRRRAMIELGAVILAVGGPFALRFVV